MTRQERARFSGYVTQDANGCWMWNGGTDKDGYGVFYFRKMNRRAHRVSYWASVGEIEDGKLVDHSCRQKGCVNPSHLRCLTHRENVLSGAGPAADNARKTHCPQGHPYDRHYGKQRYCSACERAKAKRLKKKWREADTLSC